jgi:tripartite-type tricarboxylate transporter receptor subunit TctC
VENARICGSCGVEAYTWNALFAPAGLAKPILTKVHGAATKALEAPDVRDRLKTLGYEVVGGTPEELGEHVRKEIAKWGPVVKASGAKPEQ